MALRKQSSTLAELVWAITLAATGVIALFWSINYHMEAQESQNPNRVAIEALENERE